MFAIERAPYLVYFEYISPEKHISRGVGTKTYSSVGM
jgi:hypothetical protein